MDGVGGAGDGGGGGGVERHLVVRGRVQGVGFRWFAREMAQRAGLRGWVRNAAGGAVEVEVAGPGADVDAFIAALREGPPGARVAGVDVSPCSSAVPLPDTFLIVR